MKFFVTVPAFIGAAFAASVPRDVDQACSSMGGSTAPLPSNNTVAGFTEDPIYSSLAKNIPTPSGYELVMVDKNCAISSTRYMMYVQMDSYDLAACAEVCSRHRGCDSFNIYIQRDPSVTPGAQCPNPSPIAVTRCSLYSEPIKQSDCTNLGQHIGPVDASGEAFRVAIRGSNAYNKLSGVTVTVTKTVTVTSPVHRWWFRSLATAAEQATAPTAVTVTVDAPTGSNVTGATASSTGASPVAAASSTVTVTTGTSEVSNVASSAAPSADAIDVVSVTLGGRAFTKPSPALISVSPSSSASSTHPKVTGKPLMFTGSPRVRTVNITLPAPLTTITLN